MVKVLYNGAKTSNLSRREMGKDAIQTSVNLFKLKIHAATMEFVDIPKILSMQSVTYVPQVKDRCEPSDSGFYVNVFPWVNWRKGIPVPCSKVFDGDKATVLTTEQRKLRAEHKKAGAGVEDFSTLMKEHDIRVKCHQNMKVNVKKVLDPKF